MIHDENINKILRDTFLIQSFEGSTADNWSWEEHGIPSEIVTTASYPIQGADGDYFLRLPMNSEIKWKVSGYESYKAFYIIFLLAASGVDPGSSFKVYSASTQPNVFDESLDIKNSIYPKNFGENFVFKGKERDHVYVYSNPVDLTLRVSGGSKGNFFIDKIITYGDRPRYTLFTGTGGREDVERWSLLPPTNRRRGLINGNVAVSTPEKCGEIHVADGSVTIHKEGSLKQSLTYLYGSDIGIYTAGTYETSNRVTVVKDFPEKGKWYFVSFPFDVYLPDIDEEFILKDNKPNEGGNFYYVLSYDGKKRSETNRGQGNWNVISADYPRDIPLFERGKGYLMALDEEALKQQILISSQEKSLLYGIVMSGCWLWIYRPALPVRRMRIMAGYCVVIPFRLLCV
ncbi:MAG: hypothetical protein LIP01_04805 [Tannerellaceae bacterium]|nr:hypothetical protein [Tannerellaceae bacterium]